MAVMRGCIWMGMLLTMAVGCRFDASGLSTSGDAAAPSPLIDGGGAAWWRSDYGLRRQITITAGSAEVPAGASVWFAVATDQLVQAGEARADENDWRLVRHTATGFEELARWIDDGEGGGWNAGETRTWFRVAADIAADSADTATYLYYQSPDEDTAAPADMSQVFVFGDDFEADLGAWTVNHEDVQIHTRSVQGLAGARALEISPGGQAGAGIYHDQALPERPLVFSHYLRQNQDGASFGNLRVYTTGCAGLSPAWQHGDLRGTGELDSSGALQLWHPGGAFTGWHDAYDVDGAHLVTFLYDLPGHRYQGRVDDGPWSDEHDDMDGEATTVGCVALEGEGQNGGGTFMIDNYIIRLHVDPAPAVALGPVERAP